MTKCKFFTTKQPSDNTISRCPYCSYYCNKKHKEIPFGEYQCCKCSEREIESEGKDNYKLKIKTQKRALLVV